MCVFMHEHTFSSPCDRAHVSDMCRLRDGRSERPSAGMWSWLSGLTSPWYAIPTRKTCFSDITARTIWNIPLDHLHLMWRQVHNKAVQVFFCLSLTHGTHRQSPFSTVEQALFAFLISTFLSKQKKNGADAESLNSRKTLTTNHMAFPTRSSSPRASSRLNLILLPETIFDHTSVDSRFKDYSYKPANPHQCLPLTGLLPTKIL